jgi:hypothetical protein
MYVADTFFNTRDVIKTLGQVSARPAMLPLL